MPVGQYVYRVLRDDENPSRGLMARKPEATHVKVKSHVNGLILSPYISTTATKKAIRAYYLLAVRRYNKKQEKKAITQIQTTCIPVPHYTSVKVKVEKKFTVVSIDIKKLRREENIYVFDLSTEEGREEHLPRNRKLKYYARKYHEVLIQGFIPAKFIEVIDIEAMSEDEFADEDYEKSDYTTDEVEELGDLTAGLIIR